MKAKLILLFLTTFLEPLAFAGYAEGVSRLAGEQSVICEYALSGKLASEANSELRMQFYDRPFTVYQQYEDRTKAALKELGMDWLRESEIDHLILKATPTAGGVKLVAGVTVDEKWIKVIEAEYLPDNPVLWRSMMVKENEVSLPYEELTGIYPSREPSFTGRFSHPVGFHSLVKPEGVRTYLEVSDHGSDYLINITVGIDVLCKDVEKFEQEGAEDPPIRLKTETHEFCRIPILSFVRARLHHEAKRI